jgi:hypothetical protein
VPNHSAIEKRNDSRVTLSSSIKCGQFFIGVHNETLSIIAMRVSNPNDSPVATHRCDTASTPTGFAEIVSDDFPIPHSIASIFIAG